LSGNHGFDLRLSFFNNDMLVALQVRKFLFVT
jgi:hypothetical protein